jgi:oligopeptide transport system substrate-binding protein
MRKLLILSLLVALTLGTLTAAPAPTLAQGDPITFRSATSAIVRTLDPALVEDDLSVNVVNNLFIGLTMVDPVTQKVTKSLATAWQTSDDGLTWTFTLRNDVPWVKWDPAAQKATELRKVTAGDVEYAIKRVCDPRTGAQYAVIMASMVKGCGSVNKVADKDVTDDTLNQVGVRAVNDTTLEIQLIGPLTYFLTATPMSMFRPVPKDTIAQVRNRWTRLENIVTSGAFVLDQYDRNVNRVFVRNPLFPKDLQGPGNVQRISVIVVKDAGTVYAKYQNNELETAGPPPAELDKIRQDPARSGELNQTTALGIVYLGFAYDKPPFDNVHMRRAISAVIDRKALIDAVRLGLGIPIAHLMPPGIFGAVPINEVQIGENGTDLAFAKAELAAAGFPDCKDLPTIKFAVQQGTTDEATYIQNTLVKGLGCDASKIEITELEPQTFISTVKKSMPTAQRPHMWLSGWAADYPDAQNFMHDLLSCNAANDFKRPCTDTDKLIDAAQVEPDRAKRLTAYRDLETKFFSADGEFPIAPLLVITGVSLIKPWVSGPFATDGLYGGGHYDWITIDAARQKAGK